MQHIFVWDKSKAKTLEQTLEFYMKSGHTIVTVVPAWYETVNGSYQQLTRAIIITSTAQKVPL